MTKPMETQEDRDTIVRRAGTADVDLVAPLFEAYRAFYNRPADPLRARAFLRERLERDESVVFLACIRGNGGERAVGFTQLYPSFSSLSTSRVWVLNDLFVDPGARGGGVAAALMERARRHAQATGARAIVLATARDNHAARALYERLGYTASDKFVEYTLELHT